MPTPINHITKKTHTRTNQITLSLSIFPVVIESRLTETSLFVRMLRIVKSAQRRFTEYDEPIYLGWGAINFFMYHTHFQSCICALTRLHASMLLFLFHVQDINIRFHLSTSIDGIFNGEYHHQSYAKRLIWTFFWRWTVFIPLFETHVNRNWNAILVYIVSFVFFVFNLSKNMYSNLLDVMCAITAEMK